MATGFAYVDGNGDISIKTVSMTILGTKVNTIVVYSKHTIIPLSHWTAGDIEHAYQSVTGGYGEIIPIKVERR